MEFPKTRYARSGELSIAYQVVGNGPLDLVYVPGGTHHVELVWENPPQRKFFNRLAERSRLLLFDKRGTGMSDRVTGVPTLEARMDDIRAVMDAADSNEAVLFASGDAGPLCALFAATYPERTAALILFNSMPRVVRSPDLPWLPTRAELENRVEDAARHMGELEEELEGQRALIPSASEEELRRMARIARHNLSPAAMTAYWRMSLDVDVRDVLPSIRVPTLVMCRPALETMPVQRSGHYMAARIPGARLAELPGADLPPMWGDQDVLFAELERFLADLLKGRLGQTEPDRILATVLFTDIVDATARASELGDRAWRELLANHNELVRAQLSRFRGVEVDNAGDGFLATFDGPARAILCARAIQESVRELGIRIRAGLHTGECELVDRKVGGIAVHIGARIASLAGPDEVAVSSTVKDLVAGSGIKFEDRGEHELKGIPEPWRLYRVADTQ